MVKVKNDITGKTFSRLTVVGQVDDYIKPSGKRESQWACQCDCGNKIIVRGYCLVNGHTKSCGCLQKEKASTVKKKRNIYDLTGSYGIGYAFNDEQFYFDLEDYDKIKDYCWSFDKHGYVQGNNKKSKIKFHRLVTSCPDDMVVDHINHIKYDNRKSNLRICSQHENNMNRSIVTNNTSGVTGVTWNKKLNKWSAQIGVNGKNIYLGVYENFKDAVKSRKEAEEKYFVEFRYDNSNKVIKV
jgi:hypothetical protein